MRLYVIARHGESTLNSENRVNGDPSVPVRLTEKGRDEARLLGQQVAHVPFDLCVYTPFGRTRETAEIALAGRGIPFTEVPLLGDIRIGELEGKTLEDYRAWKHAHTRRDAFPGGESLDDAARRVVHPDRDARNPAAVFDQRGRRLRRPRRPDAPAGERDAVPVRRDGAGPRRRADSPTYLMRATGLEPVRSFRPTGT